MQVTIIGSGNMAKGIAARAQAGGHSVEFHVRDTAKDADLAKDGVTIVTVGSEVAGEVVILAVPYGAMKDLTTTYGNKLDEKIVVDITNPVDFQTFQLIPKPGTSGAEEVAQIFPASKVVKAFNTVFAGTLQTGKAGGLPLDVFIAGDDQAAKTAVADVVRDGGMRPVDVGALANARHLEGFQLLHMATQDQLGGGWMSGIKIVS